jgi:hypothetical protein
MSYVDLGFRISSIIGQAKTGSIASKQFGQLEHESNHFPVQITESIPVGLHAAHNLDADSECLEFKNTAARTQVSTPSQFSSS